MRKVSKNHLPYQPALDSMLNSPNDGQLWEDWVGQMGRHAALNPHIYRPTSALHKWWGKKLGPVIRAILKETVANPAKRAYEAPGGLEGMVVLDPMMGSGVILQEALRMGASVVGVDIDPVSVLIARAALSSVPLDELIRAFERLMGELEWHLSPLWTTECPWCEKTVPARFVLYARRMRCRCGEFRVVDQHLIRRFGRGRPVLVEADGSISGPGRAWIRSEIEGPPVVERGARRCASCGEPLVDDTGLPFWKRYDPIAVHGVCAVHGEFFAPPTTNDLERIREAERIAAGLNWGDLADLEVPDGPKSGDLRRVGVRTFLELFSPRQQIFLHRAVEHISGLRDVLVRLHLALLVSASLDFNSMLCSLKRGQNASGTTVMHTFHMHAYVIPYLSLENNPLSEEGASGSLRTIFRYRMLEAKRWAESPAETVRRHGKVVRIPVVGERAVGIEAKSMEELRSGLRRFMLLRGTVTDLPLPPESVDLVFTDPPYFDSIQYGDLARFFRVWLRRMTPDDPVWDGDLSGFAIESESGDLERYVHLLGEAFSECRRVLRRNTGRMLFTFRHWKPEAWAAVSVALCRSGLMVKRFWVIHSENIGSMHIRGNAALLHDAVFLAVPRGDGSALKWELPDILPASDNQAFVRACAQATAAFADASDELDIWRGWAALASRSGLTVSGALTRMAGQKAG